MRTTICLLIGVAWCQPLLANEGGATPAWATVRVSVPKSMHEPQVFRKLTPDLDHALRRPSPLDAAAAAGFRVREGRIQVVVEVTAGAPDRVAAWLGGEDAQHVLTAANLVRANVLPPTLISLEYLDEVRAVRRPAYGVPPEPVPQRPMSRVKSVAEHTSDCHSRQPGTAWDSNPPRSMRSGCRRPRRPCGRIRPGPTFPRPRSRTLAARTGPCRWPRNMSPP